ncbi:MAG: molybdopterin molybdotransferase MoeA [Candidatus Omnitrophica bacterium]|nr:molybdopterin molybdotransferase MoeA [Candidatus Omnitrophota bacterium]
MINLDDALNMVLSSAKILSSETVSLPLALGRVLAQDVISPFDVPSRDVSSMDGFACRAGQAGKIFKIVGEVQAGEIFSGKINEGEAVRIMTGGVIPNGAEYVIKVEEIIDKGADIIEILCESGLGDYIRKQGEETAKGERVLRKGTTINPEMLGLLARLGFEKIEVYFRPKVAILSTGNEVVNLGQPLGAGQIYDANFYVLAGLVKECGCEVQSLGLEKDDLGRIKGKIKAGQSADLLMITGGVSAGKYDFVRQACEELSADIVFHKVAQRPGMPILFGRINQMPIFGLPGNPVSAVIAFENLVKPLLMKMQGTEFCPQVFEAILEKDLVKEKKIRCFIRAMTEWKDGGFRTVPYEKQSSGVLRSCVESNSLIILSEELTVLKVGDPVKFRFTK